MTVLKEQGGSTNPATKPPFVPSESWLEAFTQQMSEPAFFNAMWRYGERRGRMLLSARKVDPEAYAIELVQDIIDDTLEGRIAWDPDRVTLRKHVRDAIKSRSRHHYRRAIKQRHCALDEGGAAALDTMAATTHRETELEKAERLRCATALLDLIRSHVEGDADVCLLLDALEGGAYSRAEILEAVPLTTLSYDAAKKRLDRVIELLPNQLTVGALRPR